MERRTTIGLILLIVVVIGGAIALVFTADGPASEACKGVAPGTRYNINIERGKASATDVHARLCDTLTFTNLDNVTREIAFGPHEHHVAYDGVAQKFLNQNQSFTITLNAAGSYHWHDHLHDEIIGDFTVSK